MRANPPPGFGREADDAPTVDEVSPVTDAGLDAIVNGAPETVVEKVVEAEPKVAETPVQEPKTEATTAPELKPKDEDWTKAAVLDERRKRQDLERRAEAAERRLAELDAAPKPKRPDLFEDPDGALSFVEQELGNKFKAETQSIKIEFARELMRSVKHDYDVVEAEFLEAAKQNPLLMNDLAQATNPAKYAYETGLKLREHAELKDTDKMRARLRDELRAELLAELQAEGEGKQAKRQAVQTPSLAAATSKGGFSEPSEDSLSSLTRLG